MLFKDGKFYGDNFSFAFPNECYFRLDASDQDIQVFEFIKKELSVLYHIEIIFDKLTKGSLCESMNEKIDGMDCIPDSQILPITRGSKSGVAAYYHHAISNFYEERYQVKDSNKEFLISFSIWTSLLDDPNLKEQLMGINDENYIVEHFKKVPIQEVLTRQEVKEFFNSIILTE